MKSKSEEFCKDRFDRFLKGLLPNSTISWEEVAPADEPPEFYLSVDGTKYAVEVTILMQKAGVGAREPLPVGTIRDLLRRFVTDEVQSVARQQHYLHGTYLVTFSKPIDNFTNVKTAIQNELLSYIRTTQGLSKAPLEVIHKCGRQKCQIEKIRGGEDRVVMGGPAMFSWEGEAIVVVQQLLERSIRTERMQT